MISICHPVYLQRQVVLLPTLFLLQDWQANALIGSFVVTTLGTVGTLALTVLLQHWFATRLLLSNSRIRFVDGGGNHLYTGSENKLCSSRA